MDVVTAIGLASSIVSVTDVIARSLRGLLAIQSAYRSAPVQITLVVGHLTTVKAALKGIKKWVSGSHTHHTELYSEIQKAVECCEITVLALDERIETINKGADISKTAKVKFVLEEKGIKTFSDHLGNQVFALNLLITVAKCESNDERSIMLRERGTRQAFRQIEEDSSSYVALSRGASRRASLMTTGSTSLDAEFDFDSEIMLSNVYRQALRSVLRGSQKPAPLHEQSNVNGSEGSDGRSVEVLDKASSIFTVRPFASNLGIESHEFDEQHPEVNAVTRRYPEEVPLYRSWSPKLPEEMVAAHPAVKDAHQKKALEEIQQYYARSTTSDKISRVKESIHSVDLPAGPPINVNPYTGQQRSRNPISSLLARKKQRELIQSALVRDREVTEFLEREQGKLTIKTLFLGCGDSGKTTLLKDMRLYRYDSYSHEDRCHVRTLIFSNLVGEMRRVLKSMDTFALYFENPLNFNSAATLLEQSDEMETQGIPERVILAVELLWQDAGFRRFAKDMRDELLCWHCSEYYWNNIKRIGSKDYIPTDFDILYSQRRTIGIQETIFRIKNENYVVFDVGGSRSERKNWIYCFEKAQSIVYTVDIGCYDQVVLEDRTENRMAESLVVFEALLNSRWHTNTHFILLFTKVDKLRRKLPLTAIRNHFPDIPKDKLSIGDVKAYFARRFVSLDTSETRGISVIFSSLFQVLVPTTIWGERNRPAAMVVEALKAMSKTTSKSPSTHHVRDGTEPDGSVEAVTSWEQVLERTEYMSSV